MNEVFRNIFKLFWWSLFSWKALEMLLSLFHMSMMFFLWFLLRNSCLKNSIEWATDQKQKTLTCAMVSLEHISHMLSTSESVLRACSNCDAWTMGSRASWAPDSCSLLSRSHCSMWLRLYLQFWVSKCTLSSKHKIHNKIKIKYHYVYEWQSQKAKSSKPLMQILKTGKKVTEMRSAYRDPSESYFNSCTMLSSSLQVVVKTVFT